VKDNLKIEELFQEKFDSFESNVNPEAWTNIQQGINAAGAGAAVATKTGMSLQLKTVLISSGIIAASIVGVYLVSNTGTNIEEKGEVVIIENLEKNNKITEQSVNEGSMNAVNDGEQSGSTLTEEEENVRAEIEIVELIQVDETSNELIENSAENSAASVESVNETNNNQNDGEESTDNSNSEKGEIDSTEEINAEQNNQEEKLEDEKIFPTGAISYDIDNDGNKAKYTFNSSAKNHELVKWEFGDGSFKEGEKVEHTFEAPGKYMVRMIIVGNNEIYEESKAIEIKPKSSIDNIPNIITPNGDRINDFFAINTTNIETFYIAIRDAKGNVVFESDQSDFRWDGTDRSSNILDKGRYTYAVIAKGKDGSSFKIPGELYIE